MPPVFAHGRLRLYLLKLLDEAPRHGYEVIRLLEERFQGLYAPSAGTVYPRLAKLEAEGLVTHATEGGRKVYSITEAGRAELADRGGELADLELEIRDSVTELAAEIRSEVRGAAGDLRREMQAAASASATRTTEEESWQTAKEELRKARQEWKEQARRAKDESRRAREEAQQARRQAKEAQERAREEVQRIAVQLQEQFARSGGVLGSLAGAWLGGTPAAGSAGAGAAAKGAGAADAWADAAGDADRASEWAADLAPTGDPARDLDRLLDRFRDEVRDAARDRGVTEAQVAEARRHLEAASGRLGTTFGARS
ncbi:PadR family transcriptional regulator [Streptomyces virginiae]|uniref:PadR family transcriptional regulator n=1 Tax=Streptomyces virginiae TaxID=1961 RepID=A0A0L8N4U1_STRVG|nr:PadR family transcriptional regulator [Streptomyces virginiae]KOG57679.1 PadR family transcriptional regulator [Streptomyces virginiae]